MRFPSLRFVAPLLLVAACSSPELGEEASYPSRIAAVCEPLGGDASGVAFSDEQASSVIDMVDNATSDELQAVPGIGPAIADKLIAARPLRAAEDPLAALDAVAYVGPQLLQTLRDQAFSRWCSLEDGRQSCCVELECEGAAADSPVAVSDAEARAVLDWANRATTDELVAVCGIGYDTAAEIQAARPIRSLSALVDVRYVGIARLRHILGLDSYLCSLQGSALDTWCGLEDAQCTCDGGAFLLGEGAAVELAEAAAGVFFYDNADYVWEEYCEVSYEHDLGIDQLVVQEFCNDFVIERFVTASRDAALALAGTSYEDEAAAIAAVRAMVEELFFDQIWTWMASFEDELLAAVAS